MHKDDRVAEMERLLQQTYQALRRGEYADLAGFVARAEAGLLALTGLTDTAALRRLHRLAERNAACLLAAGRGMRAARRRLAEISSARAGLQTYDGQGQTMRIGGAAGTVTQRC